MFLRFAEIVIIDGVSLRSRAPMLSFIHSVVWLEELEEKSV